MEKAPELRCPENIDIYLHVSSLQEHYKNIPKHRFAIIRALKSISCYPLPIVNRDEALQLDGVGPVLADAIMTALARRSSTRAPGPTTAPHQHIIIDDDSNISEKSVSAKAKIYRPEAGKGPWLLLVALSMLSGSAHRVDIEAYLRSISLKTEALQNFLAGWAVTLRTLRSKNLIRQNDKNSPLILTSDGWDVIDTLNFEMQLLAMCGESDTVSPEVSGKMSTIEEHTTPEDFGGSSSSSAEKEYSTKSSFPIRSNTYPTTNAAVVDLTIDSPIKERNDEWSSDYTNAADAYNVPYIDTPYVEDDIPYADIQEEFEPMYESCGVQSSVESAVNFSNGATLLQRIQSRNTATAALTHTSVESSLPIKRTHSDDASSSDSSSDAGVVVSNPQDYEVVLVVDRRERDHALIQARLNDAGIPCEVCQLSLGDFIWVSKPKVPPIATTAGPKKYKTQVISTGLEESLVLDCIIERKTVADLASSIVDGRYNDQKCRLLDCNLSRIMYLVEGMTLTYEGKQRVETQKPVNSQAIRTAIASTQVVDGIRVVRTRGIDHTITLLKIVHRYEFWYLVDLMVFCSQVCAAFYDRDSLDDRPKLKLSTFQKSLSRRELINTHEQLFACQLRQVPGCSLASAVAIAKQFGTMKNMYDKLNSMDAKSGKQMIAEIRKLGEAFEHSRVGPKVATYIYKLFVGQ